MSKAKEEILGRIENALADVPEERASADIPRNYRKKGSLSHEQTIELFAERVAEYKAVVQRISKENMRDEIVTSCKQEQVQKLVVPEGFPADWLPDEITLWHDDRKNAPLSNEKLDRSDGVITTCAQAVAQTGTIILDAGPGQGRRAVTLVPDYHLCIVREEQIVELLPEAIRQLEEMIKTKQSPITMFSGPSATSDIELSRVEGVHGPRRLEVLIVSEA